MADLFYDQIFDNSKLKILFPEMTLKQAIVLTKFSLGFSVEDIAFSHRVNADSVNKMLYRMTEHYHLSDREQLKNLWYKRVFFAVLMKL